MYIYKYIYAWNLAQNVSYMYVGLQLDSPFAWQTGRSEWSETYHHISVNKHPLKLQIQVLLLEGDFNVR